MSRKLTGRKPATINPEVDALFDDFKMTKRVRRDHMDKWRNRQQEVVREYMQNWQTEAE